MTTRRKDQNTPTTIEDLTPDPQNARFHNQYNLSLIERGLNEVGAARSIVIDEDGVILAGNGVVEAAANAGIEKVKVVDATGDEIIAVRRSGLSPRQKKRLALYDNRTSETSEWNPEVIDEINRNERDMLVGIMDEKTIARVLRTIQPDTQPEPFNPQEPDTGETQDSVKGKILMLIEFESIEQRQVWQKLATDKGLTIRLYG